jgi:hypothetical protein
VSLDKAIRSGKEKRVEYRGSARFDRTCRNGGSCPYCQRNRTVLTRRLAAAEKLARTDRE